MLQRMAGASVEEPDVVIPREAAEKIQNFLAAHIRENIMSNDKSPDFHQGYSRAILQLSQFIDKLR